MSRAGWKCLRMKPGCVLLLCVAIAGAGCSSGPRSRGYHEIWEELVQFPLVQGPNIDEQEFTETSSFAGYRIRSAGQKVILLDRKNRPVWAGHAVRPIRVDGQVSALLLITTTTGVVGHSGVGRFYFEWVSLRSDKGTVNSLGYFWLNKSHPEVSVPILDIDSDGSDELVLLSDHLNPRIPAGEPVEWWFQIFGFSSPLRSLWDDVQEGDGSSTLTVLNSWKVPVGVIPSTLDIKKRGSSAEVWARGTDGWSIIGILTRDVIDRWVLRQNGTGKGNES